MRALVLLTHVAAFDVRQRLTRPWFCALLGAMVLLGGTMAYVFAQGETGAISPGKLSAGYMVTYAFLSILLAATFPVAVLGCDLVRRDHDELLADIIQSSPTPGWLLFLSRYAAQLLFGLLIALAGAIGYELGCRMPWISPGLAGPIAWQAWLHAFAVLAVPTLAAVSALVMLVASLTSNRLAYWGIPLAIIMLMPFSILAVRKGFPAIGPLLDPVGTIAVLAATVTLTASDQIGWRVTPSGIVLVNRQVWLAIAFMSLVAATIQTSRRAGPGKLTRLLRPATQWLAGLWPRAKTQPRPVSSAPSATSAAPPQRLRLPLTRETWSGLKVFLARVRFELAVIVRSFVTLLLIVLPTLAVIPVLIFGGASEADKLPLLPVTALLIPKLEQAISSSTSLFVVLFAGEMMWRERQARMHELIDAMALPPFSVLGGKLAALAVVVAGQFLIVCMIGIGWQLFHHAPQINVSHYAARFFLVDWSGAMMLAALSMFVHALVGYRLAAHLASIGLFFLVDSAEQLGLEHHLLIYASVPKFAYSDMNGLGHYVVPAVIFTLFWGAVACVLFILADLIRGRGVDLPFTSRVRAVTAAPRPALRALGGSVLGAALVGIFIFWNTNIRNEYVNTPNEQRTQIAYEKAFGAFVTQPQPRVASLDLTLDIFPERRRFRSKGEMILRNPTTEPIARFFVQGDDEGFELSVPDAAKVSRPATCCSIYEVVLKVPLAPGDTIKLSFTSNQNADGALNGDKLSVYENGTRLDASDVAPIIGVHHRSFVTNEEVREKAGLPRLRDAPGGRGSINQSLYGFDTEQTHVAITVSTSPDQTAIAPGKLVKAWNDENGRNVFRYETEVPINSGWTVLSARYATASRQWGDIPLSIYFHPTHARNIEQMFEGMQAALDYCSRAFSPYQFKELRLVEFPYSGDAAATAQPGLIAYSEMAGFIADTRMPGADRTRIADVTSHEVAHQWWAYQITPANLPGAHVLTESLAEYVATMIVRRRLGENTARANVTAHVEEYVKARRTMSEEQPLVALELDAPNAMRYGKGSAAFYALMEQVGERRLNRALAKFVKQYGGKHNPYPTAADLVATLKTELGSAHSDLVSDLFERITLWSFDVKAAKAERLPDGKWRTTLTLKAQKFEADAKGTETPRRLAQRVPVSVYDKHPRGFDIRQTETVLVDLQSEVNSVSFVTQLEPKFVEVNPSRSLPQREITRQIVDVAR